MINALHGTLTADHRRPGGGAGAHDAAAKGKKRRSRPSAARSAARSSRSPRPRSKGLATLALVEGAFKGAPIRHLQGAQGRRRHGRRAPSKTLQLLTPSAKGKFSTSGRYSAATVRGTKWTIADRCDGTLTHDITDSVAVTDFVRHKTIILHAGQSYLAKATQMSGCC